MVSFNLKTKVVSSHWVGCTYKSLQVTGLTVLPGTPAQIMAELRQQGVSAKGGAFCCEVIG